MPSTALLLGALMIQGLQPGPLLISSRPDLFWGVVASMYIGNGMLLVLNLPLIGLWIQILKIPYSILYVFIVMFCQIGAYSVNTSVADVLLMNIFGLVGYLMKRYQFEGAPLIMAILLGPVLENSLRRSLMMSDGSAAIFFTRPLSAVSLMIALGFLISPLLPWERIGKKAIESVEKN
jgi:putative tricarboxylic transport membrane protein